MLNAEQNLVRPDRRELFMVYIPKTNWEDSPSTSTPITAAELIRMENGIAEGARNATDALAGNVELATAGEMNTGTDTGRVPPVSVVKNYVTAAILGIPGQSPATETTSGIVELATAAELSAGNATPVVVPTAKVVKDYVTLAVANAPNQQRATNLVAGIVELATAGEMTTGTDSSLVPPVSVVKTYVDTAVANAPNQNPATETTLGIVELATATELSDGNATPVVVPTAKVVKDYVTTRLATKSDTTHTHTGTLASLPPGGMFIINYINGNWNWNNTANWTSRPSNRADIRMWAIGGLAPPDFALTYDLHSPEVPAP
jgi:hypothetical protein